jgi:anti-sigma factor RsiW
MNGQGSDKEAAVGEADLHAYADRELDPVRSAAVQAHLIANPEDAVKVQAYAVQNLALRSRYGTIDRSGAELEIARLAIQLDRQFSGQRLFGRVARAAAASVLFASVIWAGWTVPDLMRPADRPSQEFAHRAVTAHRLFAVGAPGAVAEGASDRSAVVSWLSQRVAGVPLRAPDLTADDYQLVRDRVLPSQADPAVLLVYEHGSGGHPLTLYIGKRAAGAPTSSVFSQSNDVSIVNWQAGPLAYSLVGRIDRKTLLRLAGDIGAQLSAPPPLPKQHVERSPETKPRISRAAPLRAEPAVVRPGNADSRDAADETRNAIEDRTAPKPPVAKPATTGDVRPPEKT